MSSLQPQSIQQIRRDVEELNRRLDELEEKAPRVTARLREELSVLTAAMALSRKMFGSDEFGQIMAKIQRIVSAILMMVRTYQMAMASMGPFGMMLAGISAVGTAYSLGDVVGSYG